jgi:hypothetical protein
VTVRIGRVEVRMPPDERQAAPAVPPAPSQPCDPVGLPPLDAVRLHRDRVWY